MTTQASDPIWLPYQPGQRCEVHAWTRDHFERDGIYVERTEWSNGVGQKIDLFGWCDMIAFIPEDPVCIQATGASSGKRSNGLKRQRDIITTYRETAFLVLDQLVCRIEVWNWLRKQAAGELPERWELEILPVTIEDLAAADTEALARQCDT